jgi:DNA-binding transcriptional LysR family regulator
MGFKEHVGLKSDILYRGEMVCVMRPEHPLASSATVDPKALQKHRFIALDNATQLGKGLRQAFNQSAQDFASTVEVGYGLTGCVLAEAGVGVAIVDPLTASSTGRHALIKRPFSPSIPVNASAVWAENRSLSRIANLFVQEVRRLGEAEALQV